MVVDAIGASLVLNADLRVLAFALLLTLGVTFLFGLAPALRASAIHPVSAIRGGEDPHARRRLMNALVAAQVAFCFLVHVVAGLFVASFDRLSHQPTGFSAERVLAVEARTDREQPLGNWHQVAAHLRAMPGVESAALSDLTLMSGSGRNQSIWLDGNLQPDRPYLLGISPGWFETMKIPLRAGRDFRPEDVHPRVAIVNEAFARRYFEGRNPIGRPFEKLERPGVRARFEIVGLVGDARYSNMREPIQPTIYLPFHQPGSTGATRATFNVRTASAALLRQEVRRAQPGILVSNIRTQTELVAMHTIRERLLAMLAFFFAVVALLLAAVGLFGVLDYSVQHRRREIGIRMALGARQVHVAVRVTVEVFAMVLIGAVVGLAAGVASERYIGALLYQVKATDFAMLALPSISIFAAAVFAALPPVIRAVRIDPARMLRAD
jgi:predicted permease